MKISSDVVRVLRRARHAWRGTRRDGEIYCIRPDYRSRIRPKYFLHAFDGINWQPDVYPKAAEIAAQSGARRIVDLGCGNGEKLVALHPRFEIVGIDFGANLDRCRALYPFARWLEHDLDSGLTRSNDQPDRRETMLAIARPRADV